MRGDPTYFVYSEIGWYLYSTDISALAPSEKNREYPHARRRKLLCTPQTLRRHCKIAVEGHGHVPGM